MSDWKKEKLLQLWDVDKAIRSEQEAKSEANKEFNANIKSLEATRDSILDKLAGGAEQVAFDDEPTHPDGVSIELDEDPEDPGPDENQAPDPGTYLGDDIDPETFFE